MTIGLINFPSLTAQQASPYSNLLGNAMDAYKTAVQNRYLPQTLQADIFSKEFEPLAQIASSPLALGMIPYQQQQMGNFISQLLSQSGGLMGGNTAGAGLPVTGNASRNGSFFGGAATGNTSPPSGGGGNINTNTAPPSDNVIPPSDGTAQGNPALPAQGETLADAIRKKTLAGYTSSPYAAGGVYSTPSGAGYTMTTGGSVDTAQKTAIAAKYINQQIPALLDAAKRFLTPSVRLKLAASELSSATRLIPPVSSAFAKLGETDPEMIGDYRTAIDVQNRTNSVLPNAYPANGSFAADIPNSNQFSFRPLDTEKSYTARIMRIQKEMNDFVFPSIKLGLGGSGGFAHDLSNVITPASSDAPAQQAAQKNANQNAKKLYVPSAGAKPVDALKLPNGTIVHTFDGQHWYPVTG